MTISAPDPASSIARIAKAVAVILFIGCLGYLVWDNRSLATEVQDQKSEISDYKSANVALKVQVGQCNAAVAQIKVDSDARAAAAEKAVTAAKIESDSLIAAAQTLMNAKPVGDDCAASSSFLKHYFAGKP